MAKIICIANRKGGVGKTTIATNLLIGFQQKGKTILIDTDEQQSSMRWSKQRNDINSEYIGSDLLDRLEQLDSEYDYILIDLAGRDSSLFREALLVADLLIVPTAASLFDLELMYYMQEKLIEAKNTNAQIKAVILINKVNSRSTELPEAIEYLDQFKEVLPTLSSYLSERKIYRDAVVESKSVLELKNQKAKTEIDSLLSEISTYIS
ncbi:MAG: ParA family protein [Negativicutes bacterium]|jgi:chromosome partitioning protein|nr:ParA family protein [Negativicutes bacterium]